MKLKHFFSVLLLVLSQAVLAKQSAHKNMQQQLEDLSVRVSTVTTETALGEPSITTTTAWPEIEGNNWYFSADVLLWKAKIAGTSFATTNSQFSVLEPIYGSVKDSHMHWDLGFKIGVGKRFNYDTWALDTEFTYFKTTGGGSAHSGVEDAVIPLKGPFAQPVQYAHAEERFTFFNLDLHLSRYYFISRTLALAPFLGVKNTWDTLKQKVFYLQGPHLLNNTATTKDSSKMWGMGPRAGLYAEGYLGCGLHGSGMLSASFLYSYFQSRQRSQVTPSHDFDVSLSQKSHQFIPNMQCNLGLGWSRFLNEKKNYLSIDLSYETQYYWQMNQTLSLYEFRDALRAENVAADIALYGVTVQIKLFF